jgi:GNAT superfamily N-acetyltransferase
VRIVDFSEKNLMDLVKPCISEPETLQFKKGAPFRIDWIKKSLNKGYGAKLLYDGRKPIGFIDYLPIEYIPDPVEGKDIFFLNCIYIQRAYWGKGYGRMLILALEDEAKKKDKGVALLAWDHSHWFMPASYFLNLGCEEVARRGKEVLLWKKFAERKPPYFIEGKYKPHLVSGRLLVEAFFSGRCPHNSVIVERVKRVCEEFQNGMEFREISTEDFKLAKKSGISFGILFNGKRKLLGAPTEEEIRREVKSALNKLKIKSEK